MSSGILPAIASIGRLERRLFVKVVRAALGRFAQPPAAASDSRPAAKTKSAIAAADTVWAF